MWCMWLAGNGGHKKSPKICHLRTIAQLCWAISSQLRYYWQLEKNLLNSSISFTCPHNMVNFGPLMAEICWQVWGTPGNFSGFAWLVSWSLTSLFSTNMGISEANGFASWQCYCMAPWYWASAKVCSVEQRVRPMFGRAAFTLCTGPHSSKFQ